ncbi:hypothetical protein JW964_12890 [candidate division KSB1 bacterium]|nr:hypothetical protein [candidate division KSB1 bacterium]
MKLNKLHIISIINFLLVMDLFAQTSWEKKWQTWDAPPPKIQLDAEGRDDIKGLGRLFLPAMTSPEFEPVFLVSTMEDSLIKSSKMGNSLYLRPGKYQLALGSGTLDQVINKVVEVRLEDTSIIEPDWSCLVIRIIDETRNSIREAYELYSIPDNEYYGVGYGADEQLGEHLQTWILKPGLYKIIKLGEHVNTYVNFSTVRLLPGELTRFTIVMDSETKNYIGAGILELGKKPSKIANWTLFSTLYGSFTLNSSNDVTTKKQESSMIFVAQFDYNINYTTPRHYFSSRGLIEEGWNMQKKQITFRSSLDRLQSKNIYIFSFIKSLGVYGRFWFETNLVRKTAYYDSPQKITMLDKNSNIIEERKDVRELALSPIFSPMENKEGIGINLSLLKSVRINLNIRAGWGWHQTINRNLFTQLNDSTFKLKESSYTRGPEASLVGTARISRNMLLSCELEIYYPEGAQERLDYDFENIINLKLSKNVSLDYTVRFRNKKSLSDYLLTEHIVLLRYSFNLF